MTIRCLFRLKVLWCIFLIFTCLGTAKGEEYELFSPNREVRVALKAEETISCRIFLRGMEMVEFSPISLNIRGYKELGQGAKIENVEQDRIQKKLAPVVPEKAEVIEDSYNQMTVYFAQGFCLELRAYDDGAAYRFVTSFPEEIIVESESTVLNFPEDVQAYFPVEESFLTHSERQYEYGPVSEISPDKMAHLPILVEFADGKKLAFAEADLQDYPGLYLSGTGKTSFVGTAPAFALKEEQTRDRTVEVTERADYIAKTRGDRSFPWRAVIVTDDDRDLIAGSMVYKLSPECRLKDTGWIRPGKVAWDWWNANNLTGVDFRAGINTKTYKYYIDFASRYGIEYIILDEGWSDPSDLFKINPDIDIQSILEYGDQKDVGIILWVVWKTLDNQLKPALDLFEQWGVKGIKVDFMQRDDQWMVNYYWKIAEEAAKRRLLVDFHGSYKPAGLRRAYPNVLTREGVRGLEHSKWSEHPSPEHNLILPFTRMLAGPMDFTPGAMINAQEKNFNAVFTRPMSLGTRCHQLAMYVVFESPLQMLADSPSNYIRDPECMEFLGPVPTVWDQTIVLEAKAGDYVLIARKRGDDWYIGAMTDWSPRELTLDLSFLEEGDFRAKIFKDGINADRNAVDFEKIDTNVKRGDVLKIRMAAGGGWAARIFTENKDD